jgi:NTE family protein
MVERLARAVGALGYSVTVVGAEASRAPTEWYSEVERTHDFVLYVAEVADTGWRQWVSRQADRLFRVGRGDRTPPQVTPNAYFAAPLQAQQLVDLILLQPPDTRFPAGSEAWVEAASPARLFHLRRDDPDDIQRMARVLTGQSVGVVLSGGGARAYAHVGAIRALRERKVPIDFLCGVSMGGIVGAGVAMGWDDAELHHRIKAAFVDSSPLDDIAFPILAMTRGAKVSERLREHFGEAEIADLWRPYFCLSANLTKGAYHMHRRGLVWKALRASAALPGLMPPAIDGNDVLVDGAVLKNFPADVMRIAQLGPIVGVDVSGERNRPRPRRGARGHRRPRPAEDRHDRNPRLERLRTGRRRRLQGHPRGARPARAPGAGAAAPHQPAGTRPDGRQIAAARRRATNSLDPGFALSRTGPIFGVLFNS